MENKKIAHQIIAFHKSMFDNTFNSLGILQEQTEKMVQMYLQQATWVPAEGKKLINEWVAKYKKGRDDFKTVADKNYKKVEDYFKAEEVKAAPKAKATKAK
jgi:hypothetical protein